MVSELHDYAPPKIPVSPGVRTALLAGIPADRPAEPAASDPKVLLADVLDQHRFFPPRGKAEPT